MSDKNGLTAEKFRKLLFNEFTFFMAILGVVLSAVLTVTGNDARVRQDIALIQKDISVIRSNELQHLDMAVGETKDKLEIHESRLDSIERKLDRVIVLLER